MQYNSGLVDFQTVLDADRTLIALEDSLAVSDGEVTANLVRLYKALGGGWSASSRKAIVAQGIVVDTETNPTPERRPARSTSGPARRRLGSAGCVGRVVALVVIVVGYVIFGRGGGGSHQVCDAGGHARRPHGDSDRDRQSRTAQPGRHRQRAVGHDPQRRGGRERRREGGRRCWRSWTPRASKRRCCRRRARSASAAGARAAKRRRTERSPCELRAAAEGARAERQQAALAAGHGRRRVRGGARRGRGGSGACSRGAGASQPGCGARPI